MIDINAQSNAYYVSRWKKNFFILNLITKIKNQKCYTKQQQQ